MPGASLRCWASRKRLPVSLPKSNGFKVIWRSVTWSKSEQNRHKRNWTCCKSRQKKEVKIQMNYSGEAAEQVVRMSLNGVEVDM